MWLDNVRKGEPPGSPKHCACSSADEHKTSNFVDGGSIPLRRSQIEIKIHREDIKMRIKKWLSDQPKESTFRIYEDSKPDRPNIPEAPIYLQLNGIGIALYDDGTYHIEDTTGG